MQFVMTTTSKHLSLEQHESYMLITSSVNTLKRLNKTFFSLKTCQRDSRYNSIASRIAVRRK